LGARTGKAMTMAPSSTTAARAERDLSMWVADFGCLNPAGFGGSLH
jgi:hypothetical protein